MLDTWFSSGLWPFSTLGWPEQTEDLRYFYPTSTLVTGPDIIFFWVARMIVFGLEIMGEPPFDTVMIHGIVRDSQGRKMSKSLGNGIDPLEIIDQYGTDALRFSLVQNNAIENDMRFYTERVEAARNFANKLWNAARFVLMNVGDYEPKGLEGLALAPEDHWILHNLDETVRGVTANIDNMELGLGAQKVYDFLWSDYCDWYIEMCKTRLQGQGQEKQTALEVLLYVLDATLKLLHPFMPFVTEEIYQSLPGSEGFLMKASWPTVCGLASAKTAESVGQLMELVRSIRNLRRELNVPQGKRAPLCILASESEKRCFEENKAWFTRLAYASELQFLEDETQAPKISSSAASPLGTAYLPLGELIDLEKERQRLDKEVQKVQSEIKRAEGKLANQGFVSKAPAAVVEEERRKLQENQALLERVLALKAKLL